MNNLKSALSRTTVLVSVRVSQWTARKLDRQITDETNRRYAAKSDAGRYNKLLIEAERLAEMTALVSQVRSLHYSMTRPWADEGARILPNALYTKFTDEFRELKRQFNDAADRFCAGYPQFVEERKRALNGAFKQSDYPSVDEIRSKFRLEIAVLPFPDAADFRADLDDNVVADIKSEIEAMSDRVVSDAMRATFEEIVKLVGHMSTKLHEQTAKGRHWPNSPKRKSRKAQAGKGERSFYMDSLVDNVRDLAALLPAFNLTNDPKLTEITDRIVKELCVEDAPTLRKNDDVAEAVAKSADEIVAEVGKFFA